jgi:mannose-6-phosphate isomerase-like protein (cupin superfamily)
VIHVGELYENPVTGERVVVRVPPRQSNGHLLVVDRYVRPGGTVAGRHLHPVASQTFTVVRGELGVHHGGRELRAGPGARLRVPAGVVHDVWNGGAEEARVVVEMQPGERWAQLIRQLFLLAQDGRTDARGRPAPLRAAALAREFDDIIRFRTFPRSLQRLLVAALHPIARAIGHRAIDPAYLRRELPTVDLEPLPAEIAALVPSLSTRPRWPNTTTATAAR